MQLPRALLFTAFLGTVFNSVRVSLVLEPGELHLTSAKLPSSTGPVLICPESIRPHCHPFPAHPAAELVATPIFSSTRPHTRGLSDLGCKNVLSWPYG
jgi:hypothetical protein